MSPADAVEIRSFGFGHGPLLDEDGEPAVVDMTVDLRRHFRDPHVTPELRHMTADDEPVRATVLGTPGIKELVEAVVLVVEAFDSGPTQAPVSVAFGCGGGRHRAPATADAVREALEALGYEVTVHHRDKHKPVINR